MLIEEDVKEDVKGGGDINPDALEAVFEEEIIVEDEVVVVEGDDEDSDEIDIAFQANDEGYW
jgi:predicted RNA-binding protein with PUA domain